MSPTWASALVWSILDLSLRWAWLSLLVLFAFGLTRRLAWLEGKMATWPWWLPLLIGALLAAASWLGGRCG